MLVRLEIPSITHEVTTLQLEYSEALAKAEKAKAEAERMKGLFDKGLAARVLWENARSAQTAAEAGLSQLKTKLDSAQAQEANTVVRARFKGVVAKRWHNIGDVLPGGEADPIIRVVDPARLQVTAQVPATEGGRIVVGQVATVQAVNGPEPGVVSLKVTPSTPGVTLLDIRVNFVGPTALPIDSAVQVDIAVDERRDVLAIPADAIQRNEGTTFVWVATENNQATRREIRIGLIVGNVAQVVSGLTAGENVITTGIAELAEGTPIIIGK
jgi:membrane fusion protein (multidrug efflux system)